ncbi:tetratricopeptide repeat protein [Streptomyces sp. TRM76323]|uniref:Tetratricopeptide repeat protein n=1 Tax=Streptomyces tamarix TaxID=3078565 RepID=A0ABU3QIZ9_9ACTN|nr:tetratricopeptide repeat protein [Streptomyces tamarix]MDT9682755.1 tetratricopeptide repeat protein [Streptomyces tamarix]
MVDGRNPTGPSGSPHVVRLLGRVDIGLADGASTPAGPAKQSCVLAVLALHPNQPVSVESLIDRVWGDGPPPAARAGLHSYVARLRRLLEKTGSSDPRGRLLSRSGGYLLEVDPEHIDVHSVRRLCADAADAAKRSDHARAVRLYREAAALWRGEALAGVGGDWANRMRSALGQERLGLWGGLHDAELRLGHHEEIVPELAKVAAEHPLAERQAAQLMLALYRCGRGAEALAHFDTVRKRVRAELGVEPGRDLRELHRRMLRADPGLMPPSPERVSATAPAAPSAPPAPPAPSLPAGPLPRQLPRDLTVFVGRQDVLARLDTAALTALCGPAGAGKTALAVRWAHRSAAAFPDGQLFTDLRGYSADPLSAAETLHRFLRALGTPAERIPRELDERVALFRSLVAGKRLLMVLDNATGADHVRPLLPGTDTCHVVITSRTALYGLAASHDAHIVQVGLLSEPESRTLLTELLGRDRVRHAAGQDRDALAEVAALCGHLPLALRLAAAHLAARPHEALAEYCAELRRDRLTALEIPGDPTAAMRAAFTLSYEALDGPTGRMFRLLGLHPGPDLDTSAAAALSGDTPREAERLLARLEHTYLIGRNAAGRWQLHDLLRDYAAERAAQGAEETRRTALVRLLDWYLHGATRAMHLLDPNRRPTPLDPASPGLALPEPSGYDDALRWLEKERANLRAAVLHAAAHGFPGHAWRLSHTLWRFFYLRGHLDDWIATHEAALAATAGRAERYGHAETLTSLAVALHLAGRYEESVGHNERALPLHREVGNRFGEASTLTNLGATQIWRGRYAEAKRLFELALSLQREFGNQRGEANALGNLALCHLRLGSHLEALADFGHSLRLFEKVGDRRGEAHTLEHLGRVHLGLGNPAAAGEHLERAVALHREIGYRRGEAEALTGLGVVLRHGGRHREAVEHHRRALETAEHIGEPSLRCTALTDLAETCRANGDLDAAIDHSTTAAELARSCSDRYGHMRAAVEAHRALRAAGRHREARRYGDQARELLAALGIPTPEDLLDPPSGSGPVVP